jgi:hypothetical protein
VTVYPDVLDRATSLAIISSTPCQWQPSAGQPAGSKRRPSRDKFSSPDTILAKVDSKFSYPDTNAAQPAATSSVALSCHLPPQHCASSDFPNFAIRELAVCLVLRHSSVK